MGKRARDSRPRLRRMAAQPNAPLAWSAQARAMFRAAQAVSHAGGPELFAHLMHELANTLGMATAFVAVFADESRSRMRMLAAVLDGKLLRDFDYALAGTPCAQVVGHDFRHVERGVATQFPQGSLFGAKGMDAYAAFPLNDSDDMPLGLVAVMDRQPIAEPDLAEALLKIFAGRMAAEIERNRADEALRAAALAVSSARGDSVFTELVRYLATILHCEIAFIARQLPDKPELLSMLAMTQDGALQRDFDYRLRGTPCDTVLGQSFRVYPAQLREQFPDDADARAQCLESYAGFPLRSLDGTPLGVIAVASRRPLLQLERIESLLQIFAVRAAAEIERLAAGEALRRSEASYRAIFEAAEDAIFIHDWDTGAVLDVNPKACETYGYSREQLINAPIDRISSGIEPYTGRQAWRHLQQARLGRCPPFEWQRRNQDGSLHWDEVRLKPVMIDGRHHILAFTRDITERKAALAALQAREEQYRVIFDGSADALVLWDQDIRCVDVNQAFTRLFGWERAESVGGTFPRSFGDEAIRQRRECIHAALQGQERSLETRAARKDGSHFDIEVRYLPIRYGGIPHVLSIGRDITERKAALAALQAREEQYRVIFDGSADALAVWNDGPCIVDINPTFERMFGYQRADILGKSLPPSLGQREIERRLQHIRAALAGQEGTLETIGLRKDGSRFDLELRYLPIGYAAAPHVLAIGRDITERKASLAALRSQEQKYRAIFDGSVDGMVLWNEALQVVDVNEGFVRMVGLTREQVVGRHWRERADADDIEALLGLIQGALDGRVGQATTTVTRGDGSPFEIEVRYLPVRIGEQRFALGVGRDVSERLEHERALQRSEQQYRDIFNASADALVLRDADFRIIDVNATYETMSGFSRDEVLGVDRIIANPAEVATAIRAQHARALRGEPVALEVPLLRRDGERFEIELRGVPILHRGAPHVLYMGRDITANKRAEAALRDSEEQYRAIFNASADGLVLRDKNYRAVDVNPAYLAMSGYSRDEVLQSRRVLTQMDGAMQLRHAEQHGRILAGEHVRFEVTGTRKDGTQFEIEVSAMPLLHLGEPHALYAARDISERRRAEAQRGELERQLRQAQKMEAIGQLTGGIAHDFNNILTSVIGYLVLGLERAANLGDAKLQRQLGQAHLAAQRARELIAQMLAFARRQRGEHKPLLLAPLINQTLQLLRATMPSSLTLDFHATAGDEETQVSADAVQLEQVLFNLCINARDAIQGPGSIRVGLGLHGGAWQCASCRATGDGRRWVALSVADSGSGVDPALLDRIFEPFTSTKEVGRGSGMGLAMVHGIVHDHGGHVGVETKPGAGSVFRVLLPPASAATLAAPAADAPPAAAWAPLCGRVMVVDDEAMVGEFMAELLEGWGIEVVLQRDPLQALDWLQDPAHTLDLLITDQTMPQLSGLALAQRATTLRPGLPALLYSGNAEGIDAAAQQRHGVCGVLRKPVDAEVLRAAMQRCLAARARGAPLH